MMIKRQAETVVRQNLQQNPAVVLLVPRQVGKTTLARQIASDWPADAVGNFCCWGRPRWT